MGKLGAVRLMSLTALIGLALGTAAMTVVLAAFAGLEDLVASQFEDANAPLKMESATGPYLELDPADLAFLETAISAHPEAGILPIYKKRVLATYGENQHIAYLLGVPETYAQRHNLADHGLSMADPAMDLGGTTLALGSGTAYYLGISSTNPPPVISLYLPKIGEETNLLNLNQALDEKDVFASSIHAVQPEYDQNFIIAPSSWAREFLGNPAPSYYEIYGPEKPLRKALLEHFGDRITLSNRLEQESTLFRVMRSERLVVLGILAFVVLLASFGVVSALTIIALEKKRDIFILWSMGASDFQVRQLFFTNGMLIVLAGWMLGVLLGSLLVILQSSIGLVSLGSGYVREYYPVELTISHIALTSAIVIGIGAALSLWSARRIPVSPIERVR
jgi:lipoprotein-releasing system permease protein